MENEFATTLEKMRITLTQKTDLKVLADRANASLGTVRETFKAKTFEQLTGKKLRVYEMAIVMLEEINSLPDRAREAVK